MPFVHSRLPLVALVCRASGVVHALHQQRAGFQLRVFLRHSLVQLWVPETGSLYSALQVGFGLLLSRHVWRAVGMGRAYPVTYFMRNLGLFPCATFV